MSHSTQLLCRMMVAIVWLCFASSVQAKPAIEWQPDKINISLVQGSTASYSISVNINKNANNVNVRVVPSLASWLTVSPDVLGDLQKGEQRQLTLTTNLPMDVLPGLYEGVIQLRAGKKQKNLAKPLPVILTIEEQNQDDLPPDPGEAGKQTLLGIDSDNDGLRDDIQRYIALTYPGQANVQMALRQEASTFREILDPDRVAGTEVDIATRSMNTTTCVRYLLPLHEQRFDLVLTLLKAEILNTYDRTMKYIEYDKKLSGKVIPSSRLSAEEEYKLCDFQIQPMEE